MGNGQKNIREGKKHIMGVGMMTGITTDMEIQKRGSSLVITVTKIVRLLNVGVGDKVKVTIEKVE